MTLDIAGLRARYAALRAVLDAETAPPLAQADDAADAALELADALPAALDEIERLQAEVDRLHRQRLSPQRLKELREDLDEAAAVAEVHAGVRRALNAGLNLLTEAEHRNRAEGADRA